MKNNNARRAIAVLLAVICLLTPAARAAAPTVQTDEAVYINLDYYGQPQQTRIVKGVSLNGHTEFTDYGDYIDVYNMSTLDEPEQADGSVTWSLADSGLQRFYFECVPDSKTAVPLPWDFDVSYQLNGVPVAAEQCAGASGLIEITLTATPNTEADPYYQNNMMLACATGIDMSKMLSIDAPGAQIQSVGTYKLVLFMGMPGEQSTFTVRIGSNCFESMGLLLFMAPATLSSLDILSDLRDVKDRLGGAGDSLYDGLQGMLDTMQSMQGSLGALSNGLSSIDAVRRQLTASRDTLDPQADTALDALDALAGQSDALIPVLNSTKGTLTSLNESLNSLLGTVQTASGDLNAYQQLLKQTAGSLDDLDGLLDGLQHASGDELLHLEQLQDAADRVRQDMTALQGHLDSLRDKTDALAQDILAMQAQVDNSALPESLRTKLSAMLGNAGQAVSKMRQAIGVLADIAGRGAGMIGTTDEMLDDLQQIGQVLEYYDGIPQNLIGEGKQLTVLADSTLERMHQMIADIPSLSAALDQLSAEGTDAADRCVDLLSALGQTLSAASDLMQSYSDELRGVREQADKGTQAALDGLIGALDKAAASGNASSLQQANDSIHGAIGDAEKDLEEDTNMLNLDAEAALRSVTSSQNPTPSSVQFILRTQEISTEAIEADQPAGEEEQDQGVFARVVNVFKKLFAAVYGVFAEEQS